MKQFTLPWALVLLILIHSCIKSAEVSNNLLVGSSVSADREEFNLSFFFNEIGEANSFELRFEETSTWEVRSEKSIAEVMIFHNNPGIVPEIVVCNGSGIQSERIVFKRNEIYTVFVTDDKSCIINEFLVNFKRLPNTTTAKSFAIDLIRTEVISREPSKNGVFYEKTNTLFLFSHYTSHIRSLRFDRSTLECTENQRVSLQVDDVISMEVDEKSDLLYVVGKNLATNYTYDYQLYCYSILDGGSIQLAREISSLTDFIGNSKNEYIIVKSICLDENGNFLYLSIDDSQLSYIQNYVLLVLDLRNSEFEIHKKYDNYIMLLKKMQVSSGNKYWWGLAESGHLYRKDITDGQLSKEDESYGLFYQETYDFHAGQDEVFLCQSMEEYSSGQILLYGIENKMKLAEQKIFLGTGGYRIETSGANTYISYPQENKGNWIEVFDVDNKPVGVLSREYFGADPLASPVNRMQYSPKQSLIFVFCESGAFAVSHRSDVYDENFK